MTKFISALVLSAAVMAGPTVLAQSTPASTGSSGSAGFGIDTFASNTPGANQEKDGGFASSLEKAMSNNADCGKLKCD